MIIGAIVANSQTYFKKTTAADPQSSRLSGKPDKKWFEKTIPSFSPTLRKISSVKFLSLFTAANFLCLQSRARPRFIISIAKIKNVDKK